MPAPNARSDKSTERPRPDAGGGKGVADVDDMPTLSEFVAAFFTRFDADGDASVELDEMLAVLDPGAVHPGFDKHMGALFATVDANHDGGLSRAELEDTLGRLDADHPGKPEGMSGRMHAATVQLVNRALRPDGDGDADGPVDPVDPVPPAPPEPPTLAAFVDDIVARFDANADDAITLAEMLAVLDPEAAHPGFDKHVGKVFTQVDADADLVLSRDELEVAIGRLDNEQDGKPDHVPGHLHAATVQLVGLALRNDGTHDDAGG